MNAWPTELPGECVARSDGLTNRPAGFMVPAALGVTAAAAWGR